MCTLFMLTYRNRTTWVHAIVNNHNPYPSLLLCWGLDKNGRPIADDIFNDIASFVSN